MELRLYQVSRILRPMLDFCLYVMFVTQIVLLGRKKDLSI